MSNGAVSAITASVFSAREQNAFSLIGKADFLTSGMQVVSTVTAAIVTAAMKHVCSLVHKSCAFLRISSKNSTLLFAAAQKDVAIMTTT